MVQLPLDATLKDIIIGLTLGDGYMRIQKNGINASLEISHSVSQQSFLSFKATLLNHFGEFPYRITHRRITLKGKDFDVIKYTFSTSPEFTLVHKKLYPVKNKTLLNVMDEITESVLALLFMDDGSSKMKKRIKRKDGTILRSEKGYIDAFMIAMNCFTFEECYSFCDMLGSKFKIKATVQKDRGRPRVSISSIDSKKKFLSIVKPFIEQVPELGYKINAPISMAEVNFISE